MPKAFVPLAGRPMLEWSELALREAFVARNALQCGYCTPGQICSAAGLIAEGKAKTADEIRAWLDKRTDKEKAALRLNPKVAAIIETGWLGAVTTNLGVITCDAVVRATEGFSARFDAHARENGLTKGLKKIVAGLVRGVLPEDVLGHRPPAAHGDGRLPRGRTGGAR